MRVISKSITAVIVIALAVSVNLFAATASITEMEGDIKYVKKGATEWQQAEVGIVLSDGDKIGSKENSWAVITFKAGHRAKLGPDSFMIINHIRQKTSLELFKGNLLSKVKQLSKNEIYEVATPQAVGSVRGTEFAVNIDEDNQQTYIIVYEGSVLAKEINTGNEILVPAGKYTTVIQGQPPTEPDDIENLQKTETTGEKETAREDEEEKDEDEEEDEDEDETKDIAFLKEELRREIREAVLDIKVDIETARDVIEDTKESDSSTGRTLKDIHGNLVRVGQYLLRPEPETIHFINITKRDNYKYKGIMNVADTGARIDSYETKVSFNLGMPSKISDWIGFFKDISDNDKDFYVTDMEMKISNQKDSIVIAASDLSGELEMDALVVKVNSGGETWNLLFTEEDYEDGDLRSDIMREHEDNGSITWVSDDGASSWSISPKFLLFKDNNNNNEWDENEVEDIKWVRSGSEFWGINNEGELLSSDVFSDLTIDGFNPTSFIENIACEFSEVLRYSDEIIDDQGYILNQEDFDEESAAAREAALKGFNRAENLFSGNNLDIVMTPDFITDTLDEIIKNLDSEAISSIMDLMEGDEDNSEDLL